MAAAIVMRTEEGLSVNAIARRLNVAKSTASIWVRDYPLSNADRYKRFDLGNSNFGLMSDADTLKLAGLVDDGLGVSAIADEMTRSKQSVRYWIKKLNLKVRSRSPLPLASETTSKKCSLCKLEKGVEEFYVTASGKVTSYCRQCNHSVSAERSRTFKSKCVAYKGSSCEICGYSDCDAAMDFHHLDPKEKDFEVSKVSSRGFTDLIKSELDKCALLCCRCHREVHAGLKTI